ncbi:hypothetical protein NEOLEDRAFT_1058770 [Neolentinus lepideus HHB14362 ss-1]|uniref:Ubiquitin-like 1-activating enzyme E1A n=1 Tax=Neolentinus lepideus HHB14362 ss-1 TaxID=1314782 RepID=A0A165UL66_9AGAM|nr:hypothetical protein NEOLEDRAFT_1058770 [Neolentinus lepideus HHB14362 ss-1]
MSTTEDPASKTLPVQITEDEAALYDRQIRLWGLEAQQRMRNATILIVNLKGTATETIKNIVLAGVGKLIVVDGEDVKDEDLGAGFFFRDEDVGSKRVSAAKIRIESLNPLVAVEILPATSMLEGEKLDEIIRGVDLVCVTDSDRNFLIRVNEACRKCGKPFYAGGTYGLYGYIFCDLGVHEYISPDRNPPKDAPPKPVKVTATYSPVGAALRHKWTGMTRKQTRELNPGTVFAILGLWEYQSSHKGALPDGVNCASELQTAANSLLSAADLNKQAISAVPSEIIESMVVTASHEFSPVCAVVGGMLAQDILKALAAREPPIANFFVFDGTTGAGTVVRMGMQ